MNEKGREGDDMQALDGAPDSPPPDTPTPDQDGKALSRLIRDVQATGVSFQQMSDRAAGKGYSISKPYFQKLAAGTATTAPKADMLPAIAAGLALPVTIVKRAAAIQYLDYRATELAGYDDEVRIIVAHLAGKSRPELRRWRAMIEAEDRVADDE